MIMVVFVAVLFAGMMIGMPVGFALLLSGVGLMLQLDLFSTQLIAQRIMAGADRFYSSHKGRIAQATQPTGDPLTPGGEHVAWLDAGRYLLYNINVAEAGEYKVRARYASGSGGAAQLQLNLLLDTADDPATRFVLTPSGGWGEKGGNPDHWIWSDWQPLKLETGLQKLTVMSGGGFNLNFLEIEKA